MAALKTLLLGGRGAGHEAATSTASVPPPAVDLAALLQRVVVLECEAAAARLDADALAMAAHVADVEDEAAIAILRSAGEAGVDLSGVYTMDGGLRWRFSPDKRRAVARIVRAGDAEVLASGRVRLSAAKISTLERKDRREADATASQVRATLRARRERELAAVVADPRHVGPVLVAAAASQGTSLPELLVDLMKISDGAGREVLRCRYCGVQAPLGDGRTFKVRHEPSCVAMEEACPTPATSTRA